MPCMGKTILKPPDPKETRIHMMESENEEEEELASNGGLHSMGEAVTWRGPAGTYTMVLQVVT